MSTEPSSSSPHASSSTASSRSKAPRVASGPASRAAKARLASSRWLRRLRRFVSLPAADKGLFLAAWWELARVRWALRSTPFARLQQRRSERWHARGLPGATGRPERLEAGASPSGVDAATDLTRVGWAVASAARFVPGATCLPQAMTAQALLIRRGRPSVIHTGFDRTDAKGVEGHAWLECDGRVVVGDIGLERFVRTASFEI